MTIGFSVQGSTDRAVIKGLHRRWCRQADLVEGRFRGSTRLSLRREYNKICDEFVERGVQVMIFLTDSDGEPWRDVHRNERSKFPEVHRDIAVHGVADRNIEAWVCADPEWLARETAVAPDDFRCEDPKAAFERALGIDRDDRREETIERLVFEAPLERWLRNSSFENFYEQLRDMSQRLGCAVENLREAT